MLYVGSNNAASMFVSKQGGWVDSADKWKEGMACIGSEVIMVLFVYLIGLTRVTISIFVSLLLSCMRLARSLARNLSFSLGPIMTKTTKTIKTIQTTKTTETIETTQMIEITKTIWTTKIIETTETQIIRIRWWQKDNISYTNKKMIYTSKIVVDRWGKKIG